MTDLRQELEKIRRGRKELEERERDIEFQMILARADNVETSTDTGNFGNEIVQYFVNFQMALDVLDEVKQYCEEVLDKFRETFEAANKLSCLWTKSIANYDSMKKELVATEACDEKKQVLDMATKIRTAKARLRESEPYSGHIASSERAYGDLWGVVNEMQPELELILTSATDLVNQFMSGAGEAGRDTEVLSQTQE